MSSTITVENLYKKYDSKDVLCGITFTISKGEIFALLGPNGAGKTTTIGILTGFLSPTSGNVSVLGYDPLKKPASFKEKIGIVFQTSGLDRFLSIKETLAMYRRYYPEPKSVDEVMSLTGLSSEKDTYVRKLSGGMQRRLDVAIALIGNPSLLFLDEPTTGFDPVARRDMWDVIRNLQADDTTILLTTHYLDEAQQLANRIAILQSGNIALQGTTSEILQTENKTIIKFTCHENLPSLSDESLDIQKSTANVYQIATTNSTKTMNTLTNWAVTNNFVLEELSVTQPTLEDIYLKLVKQEDLD